MHFTFNHVVVVYSHSTTLWLYQFSLPRIYSYLTTLWLYQFSLPRIYLYLTTLWLSDLN